MEHYQPAFDQLIEESKTEIREIANSVASPTFENTIVALDRSGRKLDRASEIFFNLNSAETSEEMQALATEISPQLTEFNNEIMQNEALFKRVKAVHESKDDLGLDKEDLMLLDKTYKSFVRSGANLDESDKEKYREISKELSMLSLKFGENVLAETNGYEMVIESESDLSGLPDGIKEVAAAAAKEKGHDGWLFTLHAPSYVPFMEYAENRELREKIFRAFMTKSSKGDDLDNQEIVKKLVRLRNEKAKLLGYNTYADFVLEERMAETPTKVDSFLQDLLQKAKPKAANEVQEIVEYIKRLGDEVELERWDWAYYSQKLKNEKFDLNDEMLRPYFKLENCIAGVFDVATKLYGLQFKENTNIPVYHKDVKAYEVTDKSGKHISVFYADFFPRPGKRGGAWMTSYRGQWKQDGKDHRPVVSIVCNFTPSTESKPSLLTYNEVETLFHEFGHALHGMLADGKYVSLSGTSVYWDFVELPSQILENWLMEKECLDLFAKHYKTGESIPESLVQKIKDSSNYHEAYATVRQLSFGMMDMAWHSLTSDQTQVADVRSFERAAMAPTELFKPVEESCMSTQFSHIFQGGYAAGYYSYKWAEVLDADAYSVFKEKGIFNAEVANSFKQNILSRGGSEHPMELYKRFRGQEPTVDALLERSGLKG